MDSEMSGRHRGRDYRANFRQDPKKILVLGNISGNAWPHPEFKKRNSINYSSKRLKMSSLCYYLKRLKMTGLCYSIKGLQMISHFSPKLVNRQLENDQSLLVDKT